MAKKKTPTPIYTPPNVLRPSPALLIKLGSAVVHADEFLSPFGHEFDKHAFDQLLADPELRAWVTEMTKQAFLPVKRNKVTE